MVIANSTATLTLLLAITLAGLGLGAALATPLLARPDPLGRWATLQSTAAMLLVGQALLLPRIADLARLFRPDAGWARVLAPPLVVGGSLILPVAIVLGAAWPLLLAAATPRIEDGGRRLGTMGIVNSLSAGLGAAATGFLLLPALGFGKSLLLVAGCHAGLAAAASGRDREWLRQGGTAAAVLLMATAFFGPRFAAVPLPSITANPKTEILDYRESPAGTVVVTQDGDTGGRSMFVDNNAVIGSSYDALKIVRMLGLVPGLLHPDPENVLVIGYGAGVTTATIAAVPGVETVTVAEIVPEVVQAVRLFEELNHRIDADPRVHIIANDGRNLLLLGRAPLRRDYLRSRPPSLWGRLRFIHLTTSNSAAIGLPRAGSSASTSPSIGCPPASSGGPSPPLARPSKRPGYSSAWDTPCWWAQTPRSTWIGTTGDGHSVRSSTLTIFGLVAGDAGPDRGPSPARPGGQPVRRQGTAVHRPPSAPRVSRA